MDKEEYRDIYLKSEHWITLRDALYKEVSHKCEKCSRSDRGLNVHHLSYENLWNELREDLIVVCCFCHAEYHPEYKMTRQHMRILREEKKVKKLLAKQIRREKARARWDTPEKKRLEKEQRSKSIKEGKARAKKIKDKEELDITENRKKELEESDKIKKMNNEPKDMSKLKMLTKKEIEQFYEVTLKDILGYNYDL